MESAKGANVLNIAFLLPLFAAEAAVAVLGTVVGTFTSISVYL